MKILGKEPIFPEIIHFGYLLDILADMCYGMQSDGLTFQEIESFCKQSYIELSRVEIVALRKLSFDYINMLQKAKDKDLEPPYKLDKI